MTFATPNVTTATAGLIIGTAGHIDHGKTSLVLALTGIDTDRLQVEKQRGITTELGFAYVDLPVANGAQGAHQTQRVGFIDVPGHERFVHAMVSGVGGIDVVCLVIAADAGVQPQTREHIDICRLLRVRHWVVALTKIDLVDPMRELAVRAEVVAALGVSPYAGAAKITAPVIGVSSKTGVGVAELRVALATALAHVAARVGGHVFRVPIDRVFSKKGIGTVVTGTVHGGGCAVGDELAVNPSGLRLRVRGLQIHGVAVEHAVEGARVAINVTGMGSAVGVEQLHRGDVLYPVAAMLPSHIVDVAVTHIGAAKHPLPSLSTVTLHHGTGYQTAKLQLVGVAELAPGQTGLAQLRVEVGRPLALLPGDRFVLRGSRTIANHGRTLGGGEILRIAAPRYRARNVAHAQALTQLANAAMQATPERGLEWQRAVVEIELAGLRGIALGELGLRLGLHERARSALVAQLLAGQAVQLLGAVLVSAAALAASEAALVVSLQRQGTIARTAVTKQFVNAATEALPYVLARLRALPTVRITDERIELFADGAAKNLAAATSAAVAPLSVLEATVMTVLTAAGLEAPRPNEIAAMHRLAEPGVIAAMHGLLKRGLVVKVKSDYFVVTEVLAALRTRLRAHFVTEPKLTPAHWKAMTAVSRKFSIPLIEHFDAEKLTLRVGDDRKLRS